MIIYVQVLDKLSNRSLSVHFSYLHNSLFVVSVFSCTVSSCQVQMNLKSEHVMVAISQFFFNFDIADQFRFTWQDEIQNRFPSSGHGEGIMDWLCTFVRSSRCSIFDQSISRYFTMPDADSIPESRNPSCRCLWSGLSAHSEFSPCVRLVLNTARVTCLVANVYAIIIRCIVRADAH